MALTTSKVNTDGTTLEEKIFSSILMGIKERHILLPLLTDVSSQFNPGKKSFEVFQWGLAGDVEDTLENGSEQTDGGMPIFSDVVPCDQDKKVSWYEYDKGSYLSAVDYSEGFFSTAGFKHARKMENYVAALMVAAGASNEIKVSGTVGTDENREITEADLEALAIAFDDALLPSEGRRLILRSNQFHALIRNMNLKDVSVAGSTNELRNAKVTRVYGFDIYETTGTNLLANGNSTQGMAFVADACWWGLGINPTAEIERQASKSRTYYGVRSRFGAKINTLENADGGAQKRIWMLTRDATA